MLFETAVIKFQETSDYIKFMLTIDHSIICLRANMESAFEALVILVLIFFLENTQSMLLMFFYLDKRIMASACSKVHHSYIYPNSTVYIRKHAFRSIVFMTLFLFDYRP